MNPRLLAILLGLLLAAPAGAKTFTTPITGHSMVPTIQPGGTVRICTDYPFEALRRGQIVHYRKTVGAGTIVHRLYFKDWRGRWFAKGDNNSTFDRWPIHPGNYLGLVVEIINPNQSET